MQTAVGIVEDKEHLTDEQLATLASDEECLAVCQLLEDAARQLNEQHICMPDVNEEWALFRKRDAFVSRYHVETNAVGSQDDQPLPLRSSRHTPYYIYFMAAAAAVLAAIFLIPWKGSDPKSVVAQTEEGPNSTTIFEASQSLKGITITSGSQTYTIGDRQDEAHSLLAKLSKDEKETFVITIPRGKVYTMHLSDGTQVWLNADSRLIFPPTFEGCAERRVRLDGEAYFKVFKDSEHPFIVEMGNSYARVLGTEFNARNMSGEDTHITLISGKVEVGNKQGSSLLSPGKDACISSNGNISVKEVDVDPYIYWKNGSFYFDNASIDRILTEIGRWYNVTVKLEDQKLLDYKFHFIADRNDSLNEIIDLLNQMDKVTIRRQGNTLLVK